MKESYPGYSYYSASSFVELNKDSLKKHKSWDNWKIEVNDGDVLYFLDNEFNMPKPCKTPGSRSNTYTYRAELNDKTVQIPAWRLYSSYEQKEFSFTNEYDSLSRSIQFLGGAWKVKCLNVHVAGYWFDVTLLILSPADERTRAKWEMRKLSIQMQIEIEAYRGQITQHYANIQRAFTKVETIEVSEKEEFVNTTSHFTWGEGYQERDLYKVTTVYLEKTYFKGLLLNERQYSKEWFRSD